MIRANKIRSASERFAPHTLCMVDLSILTTDPVVPDPLVLPSQAMLETIQADAEPSSLYSFLPEGSVDIATWSPSMWWLLNWWTALYPAGPELHGDVQSDGGPSQAINQSSSPGREDDAILLAPALADLGDDHHEYGPPPPPIPREVVEQLVSRGEGIVDLLA